MNEQQIAAVEARGEVFVSAGAGTGKTSVLVERFVRGVCDEGLDVESVLVITYTRKAAGELRARIRAALLERGRPDLARELDGAWISTIHGFCSRLLRAHPFSVGIDPRFHELDEEHGAVLRGEAFDRALETFCAAGGSERLTLLATYGSKRLRKMLTGVYETLRSAGRELTLELDDPADLDDRLSDLRGAAQGLLADTGATENHVAAAQAALDLPSLPDTLIDLAALRTRGARAASFEEARKNVELAALELVATRDKALLQELLDLFAAEYQSGKERESALDFEDLQLFARDLLVGDARVLEAEQLRFRSIMVDEFQDTNALQCEVIDLLAGEPAAPAREPKEMFFVGDEFQSIYGFRHADVDVFRERRAAAQQRFSLTENYRSRPEVLAAVNHVFGEEFGDGYQPLAASGAFPDPVFGHPVELLLTDKESYRESGEHWRRAEARAIARRVRELVDVGAATPGEIVLLFAAGTDAELLRGGAPRPRPADLPGDRPALLRPAAGRRPAHVPAAPAQPVRRRGADGRARLAVRRRLQRRARADPQACRPPPALHRDRALAAGRLLRARRAPGARVQAAVRAPGRRGDPNVARAALRARHLRARLRPRRARPLGWTPPLREPPQADAARAHLRGGSRARSGRLRRLPARSGDARGVAARGRLRGGGLRRGAPLDDPRGEGARVQGRRRRRCRPRPRRAAAGGRDPRALGRALRVQGRAPHVGRAEGRLRLRRGARRRA